MAEKKLREILDEIAKEHGRVDHDVKLKSISTGGANYTSELYLATITASHREDIHLFMKVSTLSQEFRETLANPSIFHNELYFYTDLVKFFDKLQEKHGVPDNHRLRVSKFYKYINDVIEVLVLEDLAIQGFTVHDRMESITWEYAKKSVEQMAKLHALSLALQYEDPEGFEEVLQHLPFVLNDSELFKELFYTRMLKLALDVVREENKDKISKIFETDRFKEFMSHFLPRNIKALIHVDYRPSNLMHRRKNNGDLEVIPVDFQTMSCGNMLADLLYFIYTGSDAEFRKNHYADLIEFYYTQLSAALRRLHLDIAKVYPKDDFEADLKEMQMWSLYVSMMYLPIVTVETKNAPSMGDDCKLEEFKITPSEVLVYRLNGIIDDYVEQGLI